MCVCVTEREWECEICVCRRMCSSQSPAVGDYRGRESVCVCVCRGQLRGNPMERGGKTGPWKTHSHIYKAQVNSPALLTSPCITSQLVKANFLWPGPACAPPWAKQVLVANTQSLFFNKCSGCDQIFLFCFIWSYGHSWSLSGVHFRHLVCISVCNCRIQQIFMHMDFLRLLKNLKFIKTHLVWANILIVVFEAVFEQSAFKPAGNQNCPGSVS